MDELYDHNDNVTFILMVSNQVVSGLSAEELASHKQSVRSFENVAARQQFHASFASIEFKSKIEGFPGTIISIIMCFVSSQILNLTNILKSTAEKAITISKLEKNRSHQYMDIPSSSSYSEEEVELFVAANNYPLVSVFDNHNFKRLSHLNKSMVVAVVDYRNEDTTKQIVSSLDRVVSSRLAENKAGPYPVICGHLDSVRKNNNQDFNNCTVPSTTSFLVNHSNKIFHHYF